MYFNSFQEFLNMGGHGLYVWLAYGVTTLVLLALVVSLRLRQHRVVVQLQQLGARLAVDAQRDLEKNPAVPVVKEGLS